MVGKVKDYMKGIRELQRASAVSILKRISEMGKPRKPIQMVFDKKGKTLRYQDIR